MKALWDAGDRNRHQGNHEAALSAYQAALELHNRPSWILETRIARTYDDLQQYDQAIKHYANAIAVNDDSMLRAFRAMAYAANGQCDLAIPEARQSLDMPATITPSVHSDAYSLYVMTSCHFARREYETAQEHAKTWMEITSEITDDQARESELLLAIGWWNEIIAATMGNQ